MSKTAEKYKKYYEAGWYTKEMLRNLEEKGKITKEEYSEITGDESGERE